MCLIGRILTAAWMMVGTTTLFIWIFWASKKENSTVFKVFKYILCAISCLFIYWVVAGLSYLVLIGA